MHAAIYPSPGAFEIQRRWKRHQIRVPVRLVVHRATLTSRINGRGTELNEGGMCVFAGVELNVGDQIELEFSAPYAPQSLRVWALVKNRYGYYYGLEFLTENAGERDEVERFRQVLRSSTGTA
jgi:PilZ domain